ncbi:MAG: hypothetical protein KJZ90_00020 [Rhodocyclaceae bacterium]|nr:hypothetical protein [Rhodocyclaceae bacterium]
MTVHFLKAGGGGPSEFFVIEAEDHEKAVEMLIPHVPEGTPIEAVSFNEAYGGIALLADPGNHNLPDEPL